MNFIGYYLLLTLLMSAQIEAEVIELNTNVYTIEVKEAKLFKYSNKSVTLLNIFSSVEVLFETDASSTLKVSKGNSSDEKEEALWTKAFKMLNNKVSDRIVKEKISPFKDAFFSVECSGHLHYSYKFKVYDMKNVGWFVAGCVLFTIARTLSRSVVFHYTSGASLGILMSFMIILMLLYKLLPYKRTIMASIATGCSVGVYFMQYMGDKLWSIILKYPYETFIFCVVTGIISMALMYYFGPPSNERTYNLIQWGLQAISIYMIYQSTYCKEFAITVVVILSLFQFISFINTCTRIAHYLLPRKLRYYFNSPPKRKLLTQEEYEEQGRIETEKALKDLSFYCSSPKCSQWQVVVRLKNPKKFANFLNTGEQFTPDELEAYEHEDFSLGNSFIEKEEQPGVSSPSSSRMSGSLSSLSSDPSSDRNRLNRSPNRTPNGRVWISDDEDSLGNFKD